MDDLVIQVDQSTFLDWVREGLLLAKQNQKAKKSQKNVLFVSIPLKYKKIIQEKINLPLLIDDIIWISGVSEKDTFETAVKYKNLGEGWLPFEFKSALNLKDSINIIKKETEPSQRRPQKKTRKSSSEEISELF